MFMTLIRMCFLCIAVLVTCGVVNGQESNSGKWSHTVAGIQGRVIVTKDAPYKGTKIVGVYLELRNVSQVINRFRFSSIQFVRSGANCLTKKISP